MKSYVDDIMFVITTCCDVVTTVLVGWIVDWYDYWTRDRLKEPYERPHRPQS